jgi:pimeloyl-ACP methyl ester carboxylesterase
MRHLLHAFHWDPGREEDLRLVSAPTLVMLGAADRLVVASTAERLARAIPRSTLRVLAGVGHVLPEEAPAEVNDAIRRHLVAPAVT